MKQTILVGSKLAIICAVAAIVLGFVNAVTAPKIKQIQEQRLQQALNAVSEGYTIGDIHQVEDNENIRTYYPLRKNDKLEGYIVKLVGMGYGGEMIVLGGYDTDGEVFSAKLMENSETPGLGKIAEKQSYMEKYIGTGSEQPVPTRKSQLPQNQAEAVTGATITFRAIGEALDKGASFVQSLEEEQ
jgi:electron transport complex protein RnfG